MIDKYQEYIDLCFQDVPTSLIVGLLIVFCLGTILAVAFLGIKKGLKWSVGLMLLEYAVLILILTVLGRIVEEERMYDFTPFWSYRVIRKGHELILTQVIANVGAFVPIGLLLGCAFGKRMKWWKVLIIGGGFSLLIETLQFVMKRGFAEVDDVMLNVVGCMIGWGVYVGVEWMVIRFSKTKNIDKAVC